MEILFISPFYRPFLLPHFYWPIFYWPIFIGSFFIGPFFISLFYWPIVYQVEVFWETSAVHAKALDELGQRIVFARDGVQNQTVNMEASLIGVYTLRFYLAIISSAILHTLLSLKVLHPGG